MELEQVSDLYRAYKRQEISQVLHRDDEMYNTGPGHYFAVGHSAIQVIARGLALSWLSHVRSILDLPCGHGRVARHLKAAFPDAQLTFCDLDKSGVDFCAETFGGTGLYSKTDLAQVELPKSDLIWVGSLFTHVDRLRTLTWLHYLARHLNPYGLLIATFHGTFFHEMYKATGVSNVDWRSLVSQWEKTGFGYVRYPGHGSDNYGVSLSKASAIMDMATSIPETRVLSYGERAWSDNHDVLILTKNDRLKPFKFD
jgi:trans-aconitate methyltransferase